MTTMIITLSISLALALVFVFIVLPKNKFNNVNKAYKYLCDSAKLVRAMQDSPAPENVKKLHKLLTKCTVILSYAVFNGLGELKTVEDAVTPICETAKSLVVVKADGGKIKKYAALMLPMLGAAITKMAPYAKVYRGGEKFTLSAKTKAEAHLAALAGTDKPEDDGQE